MNNKTTLKDRYKQKNSIKVTREKLLKLDESTRQRLNEEIDQKLFATVVETVKKLQMIKFGSMTILDEARDAAVLDVTRAATGTEKKGLMNRIASLFRQDKSPIFDALAFGSAISNFFPMLSRYVEALSSKGGSESNDNVSLVDLAQSEELATAIKNMVTKGLRPSGVLAKMGASWAKKYLKGSLDDLSNQIMQSTLAEIKQVAESVKQSTAQIKQVASQAAQRSQGEGNATQPSSDKIQNAFVKIKNDLGELDDAKKQVVASVLTALNSADLLK